MLREFHIHVVLLTITGVVLSSCTDDVAVIHTEVVPYDTVRGDAARVADLRRFHDSLDVHPTYCEQFFDTFPETFAEFVDIYGYVELGPDSVTYGALYGEADDHVGALARSPCIARIDVMRKLGHLSIDGVWQADGVNYLQHALLDVVVTEPELFASIYRELGARRRTTVMRFLFDGPGGTAVHAAAVQHLARWPDITAEADTALASVAPGWSDH